MPCITMVAGYADEFPCLNHSLAEPSLEAKTARQPNEQRLPSIAANLMRQSCLCQHCCDGEADRSDYVDPVRHLIGTASAWGLNPDKDAIYLNVTPVKHDGATTYKLNVPGNVPVDATGR
jgi:hypothetical protein